MNLDDFKLSLKEKTTRALLDFLREGQSGNINVDPDFLSAVIDELYSRQLSTTEKNELEKILNDTAEASFADTKKSVGGFSTDELSGILKKPTSSIERGRYTALKSIVGLISILGIVVAVSGVIGLLYLASIGQVAFGVAALLLCVTIALPLLAYSNLIYVFIDIEHNTRKTREALEKK